MHHSGRDVAGMWPGCGRDVAGVIGVMARVIGVMARVIGVMVLFVIGSKLGTPASDGADARPIPKRCSMALLMPKLYGTASMPSQSQLLLST